MDENPESLQALPADSQQECPSEDFVLLLATCQRPIFLYAMSLLGNVQDAEDVVQESGLVLWKKFHEYQPGTDFVRWACQIARYQSLKLRDGGFGGRRFSATISWRSSPPLPRRSRLRNSMHDDRLFCSVCKN